MTSEWLAASTAWTPVPTKRHRTTIAGLLDGTTLRPNDVPDLHLAALALEHGLRLATTDAGFAELRWFDPLRP